MSGQACHQCVVVLGTAVAGAAGSVVWGPHLPGPPRALCPVGGDEPVEGSEQADDVLEAVLWEGFILRVVCGVHCNDRPWVTRLKVLATTSDVAHGHAVILYHFCFNDCNLKAAKALSHGVGEDIAYPWKLTEPSRTSL